jgi:anthranilate synthase/aminodeoxychorismate synthase-like glutamine amidotransferase
MILLIDNFDSFTYNILHCVYEISLDVCIRQSHNTSIEEIKKLNPSHIILGPGPGSPKDAGITLECIKHFHQEKPILGICLGHQCIGEFFGAKVTKAKTPIHGKVSQITHNEKNIFNDIPSPFKATRYHSLIVKELVAPLKAIAFSEDEEVMALQHSFLPIFGVQFHPESFVSTHGKTLLSNFLSL